jgi:hypothetical protein
MGIQKLHEPDVNALNGCMNLEDTVKTLRGDPRVDASIIFALQSTYEDAPWKTLSNHRYHLIVFQSLFIL